MMKSLNMADNDYFRLDVDAPIFKALEKDQPAWWTTVSEDRDLYVNIRKNNRINVYYKGASVMELYHFKKTFNAKIHAKYVEGDLSVSTNYYRMEPEKIVAILPFIKENITKLHLSQHGNPEGGCEKEIQGKMYVKGEFLDTEYEFVYPDRLIVRIDFTTITPDGMIEFVELKRISDSRLLHRIGSDKEPKVLKQMDDYTRFINEHKPEIENYYRKVQKIMKNIGIRNSLLDREISGVSADVRLAFAGYADGKSNHPARRSRIQRITDLLNERHIVSNIAEI